MKIKAHRFHDIELDVKSLVPDGTPGSSVVYEHPEKHSEIAGALQIGKADSSVEWVIVVSKDKVPVFYEVVP